MFDGQTAECGGEQMQQQTPGWELPAEFIAELNELGFVLVEGDEPFTFVRPMLGGEIRLLTQALRQGSWRVGLASRAVDDPSHLPNPVLSISLAKYGPSRDGITLEVSGRDLCTIVPRVLRECILPVYDYGPG